ncbi:MAG: L-threonine 3-dehydrogenase [Clostridium sp.]|nr:L-threonine 3-dehydrogenase [Clostridium sp.]
MKKILVTGALGQIGTELVRYMRGIYGADNVIASNRRKRENPIVEEGPFEIIDVTNPQGIVDAVKKHKVDTIINLAAILSAVGEKEPAAAWNINMNGLYNVLEVAREFGCAVCTPSSIAAFGPSSPKDDTPQDTIMRPSTMYGVTKVAGELLCDYYFQKFNLDTRGMRFPGLISNVALPGGGTTDYAVHIYYEAIKHKKYTCFLEKGTYMDMMYMPDALDAIVDLMEADPSKLRHRNAFNVTAMSFDPEGIAAAIKKYIPEFEIAYDVNPDIQKIADSWPNSLDDREAREQWGWDPKYDLDAMTKDMLEKLSKKLKI